MSIDPAMVQGSNSNLSSTDISRTPAARPSLRSLLTSEDLSIGETAHRESNGKVFPWQFLTLSSPVDTAGSLVITRGREILLECVDDPIFQGATLLTLPLTRNLADYARGSEALLCQGAASPGLTSELTKINACFNAEIDPAKLLPTMKLVALKDLNEFVSQRGKLEHPVQFIDYQIFSALGKLALEKACVLDDCVKREGIESLELPWAIDPQAIDRLLNTAAQKHAHPSEFAGPFIGIHKDESSNIRYGCRTRGKGAVINTTVADLNGVSHVVFVEQTRAPVQRRMIEWPAGLIGDNGVVGILQTASAEAREEIGMRIDSAVPLFASPANSFSFEPLIFVKVAGKLVSSGGGVEGEDIKRHIVPLNAKAIRDFLGEHEKRGGVNPNVYAGLYFLFTDIEGG